MSKPTAKTRLYEHTHVFIGRQKLAYTTYYIDHPQLKASHIINKPLHVSVSTYRSNMIYVHTKQQDH